MNFPGSVNRCRYLWMGLPEIRCQNHENGKKASDCWLLVSTVACFRQIRCRQNHFHHNGILLLIARKARSRRCGLLGLTERMKNQVRGFRPGKSIGRASGYRTEFEYRNPQTNRSRSKGFVQNRRCPILPADNCPGGCRQIVAHSQLDQEHRSG